MSSTPTPDDAAPGVDLLMVTPQPVPCQVAIDVVQTTDGPGLVRLVIFSATGQFVAFLGADEAKPIGEELVRQATEARSGLVLPTLKLRG